MEYFGKTIRKLRTKQKMTLKEVASKLDIDSSHLRGIEDGKKFPTRDQIMTLGKLYNYGVKELLVAYLTEFTLYVFDHDEDLAPLVFAMIEEILRNRAMVDDAEQ